MKHPNKFEKVFVPGMHSGVPSNRDRDARAEIINTIYREVKEIRKYVDAADGAVLRKDFDKLVEEARQYVKEIEAYKIALEAKLTELTDHHG